MFDEDWKNDPEANHELRELLKTLRSYENPDHSYIGWGPGDDYMSTPRGQESGWNVNIEVENWHDWWHGKPVAEDASLAEKFEAKGFKDNDWDLNLIADYYFSVTYKSETCNACDGSGYRPEVLELDKSFYPEYDNFGLVIREGWHDKITQEEVQALVDEGRLTHNFRDKGKDYVPTAEEVNAAQHKGGLMGHDAINKSILVRARAVRLGLIEKHDPEASFYNSPASCPECGGHGYRRTGPDRLVLYLWLLHPRKGASRGVTVNNVQIEDLPEIKELLRNSYEKHNKRFAWVLED